MKKPHVFTLHYHPVKHSVMLMSVFTAFIALILDLLFIISFVAFIFSHPLASSWCTALPLNFNFRNMIITAKECSPCYTISEILTLRCLMKGSYTVLKYNSYCLFFLLMPTPLLFSTFFKHFISSICFRITAFILTPYVWACIVIWLKPLACTGERCENILSIDGTTSPKDSPPCAHK